MSKQKFLQKYSTQNNYRTKFIKTPLPVQPLLNNNTFPQEIKIYPITVQIEMNLYESIKVFIDNGIPLQFIMFEDILPSIISSGSEDKQLDFKNLTLYDINFIMYNQRILTYGSSQSLNLICNNCKKFYEEIDKIQTTATEDDVNKLKSKYHVNHFNPQELIKKDEFYTFQYEQNLQNYKMIVPDSKDDIFIDFNSSSGYNIKFCPPRLGWYEKIKPYLIDFRLAIDNLYNPNNIKFTNQEEEFLIYSSYSNVQLYVFSIDNDIVTLDDIAEIPIVLKSMFTKKDIQEITEKLKAFDKFNLEIPFVYTCPKCGDVINGDVTMFPTEYIFGINQKLGIQK